MIGQSHLDLAWFWTQFETYRKVGRTFSTVLQLQKKYPFYKFSMPQLKLFEMVKEYDPQLFSDLKASVLNGATEPSGMFYLEPDTNLVWGEALVRQLLRGKKILKENFGKLTCSESLIDAFGYSGNLPQILKQCGIENVFLTKMMWYNDTTEFPYSIFSWKGIDGTTVTAATMPWFNRQCTPRELKENVSKNKQKNLLKDTPVFFGWGDGGGSIVCAGTPEEVAAVCAFVEFLRNGTHHLYRALGVGFREPYVAEGEYEAAFAAFEEAANGSHRTEPFGPGKRVLSHSSASAARAQFILSRPTGVGGGFSWRVCAAGCV